MTDGRLKVKIWIALMALYIVWGSTYLGMRIAIETIPPFVQGAIRFFISGVIIITWQRFNGESMPTGRQWISCAIIGNLLLVGGNGLVSWAEQTIPSGIAALIIAAVPMFMVIMEALRPHGHKPTLKALIGLCIGFIGIYILVAPGAGLHHQALNVAGVLALLAACVFWSIGSVYSKAADVPASAFVTMGAEMLMGSVGLLVMSLLTHELQHWHVSDISARSMYGLTYLVAIGSMIGFGSYIWLLKHAPISLVATYAYVNPIVAVLLGAWIVNEPLDPHIWIATAIIIGSVMLVNSKRATSP
ncbi:MAG: EamA family transporter [Steroidobacter sp.]